MVTVWLLLHHNRFSVSHTEVKPVQLQFKVMFISTGQTADRHDLNHNLSQINNQSWVKINKSQVKTGNLQVMS